MQFSRCCAILFLKGPPRLRHLGQNRGCVPQELVALMGNAQSAGMAIKQPDTQIGFQILDGLCHSALGY